MYKALALQTACNSVSPLPDREAAEAQMLRSLDRIEQQIEASLALAGRDTLLVVVPEHFLTGPPQTETIHEWRDKAALEPDGPIYDALSAMAQRQKIYFSGNAYEQDPHFPELFFQTSFILGPNGNVLLRYRRLNTLLTPTPHDVWAYYLEAYGYDSVFPVVKTNLGNLACLAGDELLFPEVARCLAMRGAEVLLHSGADVVGLSNVVKQTRALENTAYVVSANTAGITGVALPAQTCDGGSAIVDYKGATLAQAGPGESMAAHADIDLNALRHHRQRPGAPNLLARQRFELYAESYARYSFFPPNTLLAAPAERAHFLRQQQEAIETLKREVF